MFRNETGHGVGESRYKVPIGLTTKSSFWGEKPISEMVALKRGTNLAIKFNLASRIFTIV